MSNIAEGKTYSIKNGQRGKNAGTIDARVDKIVAKGRGHTVHFTAGGRERAVSMGKFRSLLAA